ncbi:hypothetical protein [Rhodopirellula bahusiensis]|uniref:Uncharacterized protein n=1 Tax=Rhodopirellula bahusiensis TaxID=2014065 RepID=A0A2G1W9M3_9BACT|nr:hypothetical protein [Rhodopirellula bahusiensis]PHQ35349.1 hypothetical protein CEE69_10025 [Rhodopirellula bahusiensis]
MAKNHLTLQHSEGIIVQAAAQIYSGYLASGRVGEDDNAHWMRQSIKEAIAIAKGVDDAVISDREVN